MSFLVRDGDSTASYCDDINSLLICKGGTPIYPPIFDITQTYGNSVPPRKIFGESCHSIDGTRHLTAYSKREDSPVSSAECGVQQLFDE